MFGKLKNLFGGAERTALSDGKADFGRINRKSALFLAERFLIRNEKLAVSNCIRQRKRNPFRLLFDFTA